MLLAAAVRARLATQTAMTLFKSSALFTMFGCAVLGLSVHAKLCRHVENPNYTPNPEARAIYARRGAPFEPVAPEARGAAVVAKATDNEPLAVLRLESAHRHLP
jgi:hypothetical protein